MILRAKQKLFRMAGEVKRDVLFRISGAVEASGSAAGSVRVLVYHGVVPAHPFRFNSRFIACDLFEQHLKLFSSHCNIISYDDLKSGKTAKNKVNVLITFDDGYANNFRYALPILKKYNAPALFFVTTRQNDQWLFNDVMDVFPSIGPKKVMLNGKSFMLKRTGIHLRYVDQYGKRASDIFHSLNGEQREQVAEQVFALVPRDKFRPFGQYLDLMGEEELNKIISTTPCSIGAHGSSHADLSLLSHQELAHELHQAQSQLSTHIGKPVSTLAFPYGKYNANVIKAGTDAGFMDFFGTEHILGNEALVRHRLTINPFVSAANELYYINRGKHE